MSLNKAIVRAWTDDAYRAKLLNEPHTALAEVGIEVPAGVTIKVVENTADIAHLVLPVVPEKAEELSMEELEKVAAAADTSYRQRSTPGVY